MDVRPFEPTDANAWKSLNEAWIGKLFKIEPKDREVLDFPQENILAKGGHIFMAHQNRTAVGCAALIKMPDGGYELAKMTVDESMRGTGLGRALMEACIEKARVLGATRLYLETNSGLAPAIGLYRAVGFVDMPTQSTPYARADVFMELRL
ncbi:MAG: GNAT family N-acetyltransferase [Alphaproteobacteria bacterium]